MRAADGIAAALIGAFGLVTLLVFIPQTIDDPGLGDLSPAFMPRVVALLLIGLAALLALRSLRRREAADEPPLTRRHGIFVLMAAAWLAAVFGLLVWAGYFAGGAAAVAGAMLAMGDRRPAIIGATVCAAPLVLWAVFRQLLGIPLP